MNLLGIRKEIREIKHTILYKYEPVCKAFILGKEDSPIEDEIEAYRQDHPLTRAVVLTRKDGGHDGSE